MKKLNLLFFFIKEFIAANIQVMRLLLVPPQQIAPAIIRIPLDIQAPNQVFLLASLITLTPGTLTLTYNEEHHELFVHVIDTENPSLVVRSIKEGFERKIMEAFS